MSAIWLSLYPLYGYPFGVFFVWNCRLCCSDNYNPPSGYLRDGLTPGNISNFPISARSVSVRRPPTGISATMRLSALPKQKECCSRTSSSGRYGPWVLAPAPFHSMCRILVMTAATPAPDPVEQRDHSSGCLLYTSPSPRD